MLVGATGVWLGYPLADPTVGLLITVAIIRLVWQSAHAVFARMLDGVDPEVLDAAERAARHVPGVHDVAEVRARWTGHRLTLELNVAVSPDVTVTEGHRVAKEVRHQVLHHVPHVSGVTVHVDPVTESGESFHHIGSHAHDGLPVLLYVVTLRAWHYPPACQTSLGNGLVHDAQHLSFVLTGLLFWWPIVAPAPRLHRLRGGLRYGLAIAYLIVATGQNTLLGTVISLSGRVLYPAYAAAPRLFGLSVLDDQALAGGMPPSSP